jgi:hypothetical protein
LLCALKNWSSVRYGFRVILRMQESPRCLIPRFDGAILRRNGWKHYGTSSSQERHDHSRRRSSNTAIASFALVAEPGDGHQSQDRGEAAQARDGQGHEDRADGAPIHRADRDREGDERRVPKAHAVAAGRLSLCSSTFDPAPDPLSPAPLPSTPWHLEPAGCRGRQNGVRPNVRELDTVVRPHREVSELRPQPCLD